MAVEAEGYEAAVGPGLCVLLAVERQDDEAVADWMARKLANLRIFPDDDRNMNRSLLDTGGAVLLVSQFTLAGSCAKGNRPSFDGAAEPEHGRRLYEHVAQRLRGEFGVEVVCGVFGAMMRVTIVNDGPVTLVVEKKARRHDGT